MSGKGPEVSANPGSDYPGAPEDYRAARRSAAWFPRPDRVVLRVEGRAPGAMLKGMVTGALPPELVEVAPGVQAGRAPYSLILTPKGRPLTDLRLFRVGAGEGGTLLMEPAAAGMEGARSHFARYLPPRMAKVSEGDPPLAMITVAGPGAPELLSRELFDLRVDPDTLRSQVEGQELLLEDGSLAGIRVVASGELDAPAWDVVAPGEVLSAVTASLTAKGVPEGSPSSLLTLRLERGRPAYGVEVDEEVLPPEAGLQDRAIDHMKGCYTGQEVIVRIRDRGQVNRHLRGLVLGDLPLPTAGTPLFIEGRERPGGEVRSAVHSPRAGGGIALAYVRREVAPPGEVRLGTPDGHIVAVRELNPEGWLPERG